MQAAIDRVLQTYGLMVNLTAEEEQATRRRLEKHLAGMQRGRKGACGRGTSLFARTRPCCAAKNGEGSNMTDNLTKRDQPDRSKINMKQDYEVHYWTKHLNISKEELQKVVDKVGNSAAAIRKELLAV